ncbi:polyribonucleotide nucleotidyltransferase [Anaerococcus hydrogenalis]|uniref:Polyribonucleotide nucleotidyltransferase n=1 Tax=Anaerococcus hydrogenalis TaxID=33029 RepID=A0A2N6UKB4_9FIRM|nr:polyribonucleotide nucleotidyltransferase [Anaerococcus hydrogenalis]MBS5988815.1 polyribonucleotide nucleotidyltransferase [Anaerococcus hydrogenalis]MDK7694248.1 polyribonucleotide nucleotidyltransferase [Anaerococcus hydrogenalis]MDK7696026.1 polyribonucleotide nucleotidyltransferase [Anaerococcus hydrogenalis]MDK7707275.1 polyribonucleotide nucleotidyltransferase [Anaerococcus hydrogenalis]PMC82301.1 polyribonucleotide nucleotidyltransferase [Anaerococcus hydrogenalis]
MEKTYEYKSQNGSDLSITIGKVAEQTNGECLIRSGDTILLVTAVASDKPREGIDFFPLICDYQEKLYAVGKIPGGFIKREGKASDKAILISRQMDRPLRPLFPENFYNDVQVIATPFSVDEDNEPDCMTTIGASIALGISDIPFYGPVAAVSVGYVDGKFIVNPNKEQREKTSLNLTVAGTADAINMVEAGANELSEDEMLEAMMVAHAEIKEICSFIQTIIDDIGKEKMEVAEEVETELQRKIKDKYTEDIKNSIRTTDKVQREDDINAIEEKCREDFLEEFPESEDEIHKTVDSIMKKEVRRMISIDKIRPDGRKMTEIRPLSAEAGLLPRAHGSGLFQRGQTQVLSVLTLGSPGEEQVIDSMNREEITKRYIHQYNFPPFCVGDIRPLRGPGRREVGHGHLAERALIPVLPDTKDFPYTIRVVSEVLSSNGSSSQASICGSTLSLMDAGVPIKKPVAGIAMGLIKEEDSISILTDIQGLEDHLGDMDFKVAGTKDGITALQMDMKISGINKEVLQEALADAHEARLKILDVITSAIDKPREDLSKYAPRIFSIDVDPEKVRDVIGAGGKTINKIIDETGVKIETEDDGHITVASNDGDSGKKAIQMIKSIVTDPKAGDIYEGEVKRIMNFGAFVEIAIGKEGLLHISQIDTKRTEKVEDVLKIGDKVRVKVTEIDRQGRINLSRKALLIEEEKKQSKED